MGPVEYIKGVLNWLYENNSFPSNKQQIFWDRYIIIIVIIHQLWYVTAEILIDFKVCLFSLLCLAKIFF